MESYLDGNLKILILKICDIHVGPALCGGTPPKNIPIACQRGEQAVWPANNLGSRRPFRSLGGSLDNLPREPYCCQLCYEEIVCWSHGHSDQHARIRSHLQKRRSRPDVYCNNCFWSSNRTVALISSYLFWCSHWQTQSPPYDLTPYCLARLSICTVQLAQGTSLSELRCCEVCTPWLSCHNWAKMGSQQAARMECACAHRACVWVGVCGCVCVCVRTHHVIGCLHQSKRLTITCVRTIQYTCSTIVLRLCTVFHLFLAVLEYCTKAGIYLVLDTLQYHKELCKTLRLVNDGGYRWSPRDLYADWPKSRDAAWSAFAPLFELTDVRGFRAHKFWASERTDAGILIHLLTTEVAWLQ